MFGDRIIRRLADTILSATIGVSFVFVTCKKQNQSEIQPAKPSQNLPAVQKTEASQQISITGCNFTWVDQKDQASIWKEVAAAFHQELLPDRQGTGPNASAYRMKQIARMARCGDAVLVVFENSATEKERAEWDRLFELYNFNLARNEKVPITAKGEFWSWQFDQLAHFDDGPAPDVTFHWMSCTECEPLILLGAMRFNAKEQKWELRQWPKEQEGVSIADWAVGIDGSVEEYETLAGIGDFGGKGHDEVAVWTHYRDVDEKDPQKVLPAVTTLTIYDFQNGQPTETEIKNLSEIERIKKVLCKMDVSNEACKKPR